jgi:hypothetical protein
LVFKQLFRLLKVRCFISTNKPHRHQFFWKDSNIFKMKGRFVWRKRIPIIWNCHFRKQFQFLLYRTQKVYFFAARRNIAIKYFPLPSLFQYNKTFFSPSYSFFLSQSKLVYEKTSCHNYIKFISDNYLLVNKTLQLFASLFTLNTNTFKSITVIKRHIYRQKSY